MRDHKPQSKLVLNEATNELTRVVDEVGPSSRVDETTTSDQDQSVKAMDLEMESMYFNSIWELVDLLEAVKPIGCKWIYKRKRDSAGKNSKKDLLHFKNGVHLSKEPCPKTPQEVENMRHSTMEAEYVAACEAAIEAVWFRKFLHDLEVVLNMNLPITLYCDNSGAVANSKEPRSHKRGKHIERKYHLIREIVQQRDVIVTKIALKHNISDPFTKTLTTKVFEGHLESLGLRDMYIR
ncbi:retrovirus-related pol polyprotein from transposon tnt 1-94 [Cucumis melo var. makuwa]|uniref:Retrovirus-related pol polyprotein from transposon tnt 1-94 n=1 Tax=Cucumis melo var. makuwa TaxID=1194695 RepID=A0A5A7SWB2_CUCMM|nr:retrovirus-related pol polyprotein from transposon tnt 1-94 [Cucumis melo var. makuwa]